VCEGFNQKAPRRGSLTDNGNERANKKKRPPKASRTPPAGGKGEKEMQNYLTDLQACLFEAFIKLKDVKYENLQNEIDRNLALSVMAKTMIANGALMAKCADMVTDAPAIAELPLIPLPPAEKPVAVDGKRKALLANPKTRKDAYDY